MLFPSTLIIGNDDHLINKEVLSVCHELETDLGPNNPDVLTIRTDYSINQVRSLGNFFSQKPLSHSNKLVIIYDADQLHHEAQNSLLKILEEPGKNNYLILTSHLPHSLLPTILSRCRHLITSSAVLPVADLIRISPDPKTNLAAVDQLLLQNDSKTVPELIRQQIAGHQQLLSRHPTSQNANIIEKLILATKMIKANIDPRSTLDYFFFTH